MPGTVTSLSPCSCTRYIQLPFLPNPCCVCLPYYPADAAIRFPPGCVVYDDHPPPTDLLQDNYLMQYHIGFTDAPVDEDDFKFGKLQHIQILDVIDGVRESARPYVKTKIDRAMDTCDCPMSKSFNIVTLPCDRCPVLPFFPMEPLCKFPPNPVVFYDSETPPILGRHSPIDSFYFSFLPTPNGLIQHVQLRTKVPAGVILPEYDEPYLPDIEPAYLRPIPFPSAPLPSDGDWGDV